MGGPGTPKSASSRKFAHVTPMPVRTQQISERPFSPDMVVPRRPPIDLLRAPTRVDPQIFPKSCAGSPRRLSVRHVKGLSTCQRLVRLASTCLEFRMPGLHRHASGARLRLHAHASFLASLRVVTIGARARNQPCQGLLRAQPSMRLCAGGQACERVGGRCPRLPSPPDDLVTGSAEGLSGLGLRSMLSPP